MDIPSAAVLMATPCTNSLGGEEKVYRKWVKVGGRSIIEKTALMMTPSIKIAESWILVFRFTLDLDSASNDPQPLALPESGGSGILPKVPRPCSWAHMSAHVKTNCMEKSLLSLTCMTVHDLCRASPAP